MLQCKYKLHDPWACVKKQSPDHCEYRYNPQSSCPHLENINQLNNRGHVGSAIPDDKPTVAWAESDSNNASAKVKSFPMKTVVIIEEPSIP